MFVTNLALDWFRSYRQLVISLEPGVNVFLGANGQGKTNLVEALNYLAVLSTHRAGNDAALIFRGNPEETPHAGIIRARVSPGITPEPRSDLLEIEIVSGKPNRAMLNRHKVRPRDLVGHLSTVLFAPEDLELISGDPGVRRSFLDRIALQLHPVLAGVQADLHKTLRQRAAYLRDVARRHEVLDEIQLEIWDDALVPLFAKVMRSRQDITLELQQLLPGIYAQIAGQAPHESETNPNEATPTAENPATARMTYRDNVSKTLGIDASARQIMFADTAVLETQIRAALRSRHLDEARRGVNLCGTHRDDLEFCLHDFPVKGYASHGETWSFALALRLAEFYLLRQRLGDAPVLLLDDVFAELDSHRRAAILGAIEAADQVWITSAVGTELPEDLHAQVFRVVLNPQRESQVLPQPFGNNPDPSETITPFGRQDSGDTD